MRILDAETREEKGNGTAAGNPDPDVLGRLKAGYLATKAESERQQAALKAAEALDLAERAKPVKQRQHALIRDLIAAELGGTTATNLADAAAALEGFTPEFESDEELAKAGSPDAMPRLNRFPVRLKRDGLADLIVTFQLVGRSWEVSEATTHYYGTEHKGWWVVQSYWVGDDGSIHAHDDAHDLLPHYLCESFGEAIAKAEEEWRRTTALAARIRAKASEREAPKPDDGGTAFPVSDDHTAGLSKREYIASHVLAHLATHSNGPTHGICAHRAVGYADALLAELAGRPINGHPKALTPEQAAVVEAAKEIVRREKARHGSHLDYASAVDANHDALRANESLIDAVERLAEVEGPSVPKRTARPEEDDSPLCS